MTNKTENALYEVQLQKIAIASQLNKQRMQEFKSVRDINTNTLEGRYLVAALAILTTQDNLIMFGNHVRGSNTSPDEMLNYVARLQREIYPPLDTLQEVKETPTFLAQLNELINKYSKENESNTPDFILTAYVRDSLNVFNTAVNHRERWYGRQEPGKLEGQDIGRCAPLAQPNNRFTGDDCVRQGY